MEAKNIQLETYVQETRERVRQMENALDRFRNGTLQPDEQKTRVRREALQYLIRLVDNISLIKRVDVSRHIRTLSGLASMSQNSGKVS